MLKTTLPFDQKARASGKGERGIFFFVLTNAHGERVYADVQPTEEMVRALAPALADGSFLADGSVLAGGDSRGVLEMAGRVLRAEPLREGTVPSPGGFLANLGGGEVGRVRLVLANARDESGVHPLSKIIAQENLLSASLECKCTFPGLGPRDALSLGKLVVESYRLTKEAVEIEARAV